MKLLDRYWLWRHGYCTFHLVKKNIYSEYADFCPLCEEEKAIEKALRLRDIERKAASLGASNR